MTTNLTTPRPLSTSCQRNGTHLRVLIAVPADAAGTLDIHRIADDLAVHLGRIIVLIAPTADSLDQQTDRLRTAARTQEWDLVPADGMHARIITALTGTQP